MPAESAVPTTPSRASGLLTARALWMFLLLNLGFRVLGFHRVQSLVTRPSGPPTPPPRHDWPEHARSTFEAVQKATSFYYRRQKDCLPKALTTFYLLRRQGVPARLCYGVRKFPFAAHAWVEASGEILDDRPSRIATYTVIHQTES